VHSKHGGAKRTLAKPAPDTPALVLELDGKSRRVPPDTLEDDKKFDALLESCKKSKSVTAWLTEITGFTPTGRIAVLDFLAVLKIATYPSPEGLYANILEAVLAVDPGQDLVRQEYWRKAALETAAIFYEGALVPACNRIREAMVKRGIKGVRFASLIKDAQAFLAAATKPALGEAVRVSDVLPDAPVPKETIVPANWVLTSNGVSRFGSKEPSWSAPVLISELGRDQTRGTETATLVFQTMGGWKCQQRITTGPFSRGGSGRGAWG